MISVTDEKCMKLAKITLRRLDRYRGRCVGDPRVLGNLSKYTNTCDDTVGRSHLEEVILAAEYLFCKLYSNGLSLIFRVFVHNNVAIFESIEDPIGNLNDPYFRILVSKRNLRIWKVSRFGVPYPFYSKKLRKVDVAKVANILKT